MRRLLSLLVLTTALSAFGEKGYLFSYFSQKGANGRRGEAAGLHLAWSLDGLTWTALNDDEPILEPWVGRDRLMRDPCICQGPDGTFHLVWTSGWADRIVGYARSRDLLHWSEQRALPVMESEPTARNCWAPELTWNPDDGLFYLYWSSTIPGRHAPIPEMDRKEAGLNHRIYLTTTKDFKTFSPTKLWFDPAFSAIDAAVVKDPEAGDWMLFVKNENHTPVEKSLRMTRLPSLSEALPKEVGEPLTVPWTEGPSPIFIGGALHLYYEFYREGRIGLLRSMDRGRTWTDLSSELRMPRGARHGTVFAVDRAVLDGLVRWDADRKIFSAEHGEPSGEDATVNDISLLEVRMSAEKLVYFGQRVRISGEVEEVVRVGDNVQLVVGDFHGQVVVTMPLADAESVPESWEKGARVRATGLLTYRFQDGRDVRLSVERPSEVEILRPAPLPPEPPWWTPRRVAIGAGSLTLLGLVALAWALKLKRQKAMEARVSDAVQKERLRLSQDLHDGYQQLLAGCMFRLTAAQTLVGRQLAKEAPSEVPLLEKADVQLEGLRSSLTHAQDELRAALWTMKEEAEGPAAMSDLFRYAAARLPQWEGIVRFVTEGEEKAISRRYAGVLLMILQEAVGNALRHGRATAVTVKFVFGRKGVAMLVEDNGCGFDVAEAEARAGGVHLGLASMRTRAERIGGRCVVRSRPGVGTEVKIVVEV